MASLKDLATKIQDFFSFLTEPTVIQGGRMFSSPAPSPTPTPAPQKSEIERKIRAGLEGYSRIHAGGRQLPIMDYVPQFAQAAEKYPIFQQNPYLLPQMSILESSAGLNVTRPNNPLNWGARIQQQGLYQPKSWEESINDAITAIAGDIQARPPSQPNRFRQTTYYGPFRQSGNLRTFADIYEPANPDYYPALMEGIRFFEGQ